MEKDHGIATSNPLGFNNTYVMSVKPETAEQYNLKTLSDLIEKSPELNLGCTVEFIQRGGLPAAAGEQVRRQLQGRVRPGRQPAL